MLGLEGEVAVEGGRERLGMAQRSYQPGELGEGDVGSGRERRGGFCSCRAGRVRRGVTANEGGRGRENRSRFLPAARKLPAHDDRGGSGNNESLDSPVR